MRPRSNAGRATPPSRRGVTSPRRPSALLPPPRSRPPPPLHPPPTSRPSKSRPGSPPSRSSRRELCIRPAPFPAARRAHPTGLSPRSRVPPSLPTWGVRRGRLRWPPGGGGRGEWRKARSAREAGLVLRARNTERKGVPFSANQSAMCFPARTHQREGERHGHQDREKVDGQRSPVDRPRDRVERRHILESPPTRAQQPAGKHWALGRFDSEKMRFSGPNFGKLQGTNQSRGHGRHAAG